MSLAQELRSSFMPNWLRTRRINDALRNHDVEEIAQYIRSSENYVTLRLDSPLVNGALGHHISDAIFQNAHIKKICFDTGSSAIRDLVAWIGSRHTLVNMTSLESVVVYAPRQGMSVLDFSVLFPLLLTSTSLREFDIYFHHDNGCSDDVMSTLLSYLGTASLREFRFNTRRLSEAAFTALCNGVASSTVRHFTLWQDVFPELNLEIAAELLAQMIVESSLEYVTIWGGLSAWNESLISALKLTAPVRNMDFAFTQIGDDATCLRINQKWRPLIFSANTPLALWPRILEKSHASPETSHGSADIAFFVLKEKPDLVPAP